MLATQIEVSDGTLNIINVGIEFFEQTDISVSLDQSSTPLVQGVDYQWTAATTIQFLSTAGVPGGLVPLGTVITLRRRTESEEMFNIYDGGAPFSRLTLDENFEQLLFLSQEFREGLGLDGLRNDLNMNGYKVINLGDPVNPGDATNKLYVDTEIAEVVATGSGDFNAAVNVNYVAPDLSIHNLQELSGTLGASLIGMVTPDSSFHTIQDLSSAVGADMIGTTQPLTGAGFQTQQDKNAQTIHINDFPSTPANTWLSRAIDGTPEGWTLQLGSGNYIAKFAKARSNITIRGSGMPFYNVSKTALVGFGTTIQGTFGLTGINILVEKCGFDSGLNACNALNGGVAMDAFVLNDAARNPLYNCVVRDCIALCKDAASPAHNFLLEGCVDSRFENLHARYGQWGVVMKTVNSTADGLYAYACSQAGFTFKSDTGVAGAVALRSSATNVHIFADDYAAGVSPILIYAATSSLADFQLTNFHINGGLSGLKLLCDSRAVNVNLMNGVTIGNGTIRNCTTFGLEAFGAMTDVLVSNVAIIGTVSNKAVKVWSDCLGIELSNVVGSSPVVNALNFDLAGRFTLNGVYSLVNGDYNSPSGINLVPDSPATFKLGTYLGTIGFSGVQTWTPAFTGLAIVNGTGGVTITGSYVIIGKMIKWRVKIATTGTATTASTASTTFINNLPFLVLQNGSLRAISGTVTQGGVGLVAEGGTNGYTPTWTAYNGTFTIEGEYFFQA